MRSGLLRHRVQIQESTKAADAAGTLIETWVTVHETYADIRPVRAREYVREGQVQADITHTIQIRYFEGLSSRHRLKWGARIFGIEGPPINVMERNRTHEFAAKELES